MINKFRNLIKRMRKRDYDYIFNAISWRLPDWLFHWDNSFLLTTDQPNLRMIDRPEYFKKPITIEDLEILERFGFPKNIISSRLASGDKAVIVGKDSDILAIAWGASAKRFLRVSGMIIDPGDDGVIIYGLYTREDARRKGLMAIAYHELYSSYLADGRRRIYSCVNSLNTTSLEIHRRLNFTRVGEAIYVIFLGVGICLYKSWPFPIKKLRLLFKKRPNGLKWI